MSKNEISLDEASLLINKLIRESIPVVSFFVSSDGVQVKLRGLASSASSEIGLIIVGEQDSPPTKLFLSVPLGNPIGAGCRFFFGDKRELDEEVREDWSGKLGEAALSIVRPDGSRLNLFFTP